MRATMTKSDERPSKVSEVWQRLEQVTDPELDESVTEMDFVTDVDVDADDRVHIGFRLPTYWCAANFAFMMADDMRSVVMDLPWVKAVDVVLGEHMYADTINRGVAEGRSFRETFGDEADGDLDEIRRTFLLKAFQRRQEALLVHLRESGLAPAALVGLRIADLASLPVDSEGRKLIDRYLERRSVVGAHDQDARMFVTTEGGPLQVESFEIYLKGLRRVRVNAEFNGALCRGLLSARFDTTTPYSPRAGKACSNP
jgi:metal-sulfur cluster biosynthetic enzyme